MADNRAVPLVSAQPRAAVNVTLPITIAADNTPMKLPGLQVPAGLGVSLRGATKLGANVSVVRVSTDPDELRQGGGRVITPDTEIGFPCNHLGELWYMGTAADGLIVTISGVPVG